MRKTESSSLEIEPNSDGSLALIGELDLTTLPIFDAALARSLSPLVLDLSGLRLIDRVGIARLLKIATSDRRRLRLMAPTGQVRHAIHIIRLHLVPGVEVED